VDQYALGWSEVWDHHLEKFSIESVVRIVARHKNSYRALGVDGKTWNCQLSGRMVYRAELGQMLPAVGDWCALGASFLDESNELAALVETIFERRSQLARMVAGIETDTQVLAANVDLVFIVTSMNKEFNINRLRRYVLIAEYGGVQPLIVLSKSDLAENIDDIHAELDEAFPHVPYITTSSVNQSGIDDINARLVAGKTAVFVGSSGVGKSTLLNTLLSQDIQKTREIRGNDHHGRHTTSSAGLFFLPSGGMIIDTPGLREVQVLGTEEQLNHVMPSVSEFAAQCRFRDCSHSNEPGCAVVDAVEQGELEESEFDSYLKLEREVAYGRRKLDQKLANAERKKWKKIAIDNRKRKNELR
jgi:ribosome biogenesis GTPase / thiamine phosphate phosphatase